MSDARIFNVISDDASNRDRLYNIIGDFIQLSLLMLEGDGIISDVDDVLHVNMDKLKQLTEVKAESNVMVGLAYLNNIIVLLDKHKSFIDGTDLSHFFEMLKGISTWVTPISNRWAFDSRKIIVKDLDKSMPTQA